MGKNSIINSSNINNNNNSNNNNNANVKSNADNASRLDASRVSVVEQRSIAELEASRVYTLDGSQELSKIDWNK